MQFSKDAKAIQNTTISPNSDQKCNLFFFLTKTSQSIYITNSVNNNTFM